MSGLVVVPGTTLLLAALGVLALGLFVLAARLARWPLWAAGWGVVILAVALAMAAHARAGASEAGALRATDGGVPTAPAAGRPATREALP